MKQIGALHKITEGEYSLPESETASNKLHAISSDDTPLRIDAFELPDEEKIKIIAGHFRGIMNTLGLDLQDDSLKNTPERVAKMFVKEIFSGLDPANKPSAILV
jgi:GTP cyclohydrolase I